MNFHTRKFHRHGNNSKGRSNIENWREQQIKPRSEEIKEAQKSLREPENDGNKVLLLIEEVTVVTGQNRKEHKSNIFYDDGSTCSMVTKDLVARWY